MAGLPSGDYLIQQIGDEVILFHRDTEQEVVRFHPARTTSFLPAQQTIAESTLTTEDKAMAHFWSGYFYAYAGGGIR